LGFSDLILKSKSGRKNSKTFQNRTFKNGPKNAEAFLLGNKLRILAHFPNNLGIFADFSKIYVILFTPSCTTIKCYATNPNMNKNCSKNE